VFDTYIGAVFQLLGAAFLGALLNRIWDLMRPIAAGGDFSNAESAQRILGMVDFAVGNWLRAMVVAALVFVVVRAVIEAEVTNA